MADGSSLFPTLNEPSHSVADALIRVILESKDRWPELDRVKLIECVDGRHPDDRIFVVYPLTMRSTDRMPSDSAM